MSKRVHDPLNCRPFDGRSRQLPYAPLAQALATSQLYSFQDKEVRLRSVSWLMAGETEVGLCLSKLTLPREPGLRHPHYFDHAAVPDRSDWSRCTVCPGAIWSIGGEAEVQLHPHIPLKYHQDHKAWLEGGCEKPVGVEWKRQICANPSWRRPGRDNWRALCVLVMHTIGSEPLMAMKASQAPKSSHPLYEHSIQSRLTINSDPVLDQSIDLIASDSLAHGVAWTSQDNHALPPKGVHCLFRDFIV